MLCRRDCDPIHPQLHATAQCSHLWRLLRVRGLSSRRPLFGRGRGAFLIARCQWHRRRPHAAPARVAAAPALRPRCCPCTLVTSGACRTGALRAYRADIRNEQESLVPRSWLVQLRGPRATSAAAACPAVELPQRDSTERRCAWQQIPWSPARICQKISPRIESAAPAFVAFPILQHLRKGGSGALIMRDIGRRGCGWICAVVVALWLGAGGKRAANAIRDPDAQSTVGFGELEVRMGWMYRSTCYHGDTCTDSTLPA